MSLKAHHISGKLIKNIIDEGIGCNAMDMKLRLGGTLFVLGCLEVGAIHELPYGSNIYTTNLNIYPICTF